MESIVTKPKEKDSGLEKKEPKNFHTHSDKRAAERKGDLGEGNTAVVAHFQAARLRDPSPSGQVAGSERQRRHSSARGSSSSKNAPSAKLAVRAPEPLAEWRIHVHAARRRTIIVIMTMLRLRRGHRHTVRLPRLDDLGFFIPVGLEADKASFIKEFLRYVSTQQQVGS